MTESSSSVLLKTIPLLVKIAGGKVVIEGQNGGNVRGHGKKLDIDWVLDGPAPGQTLEIRFWEFLSADDPDPPGQAYPVEPPSPSAPPEHTLAGDTHYTRRLKGLGKGELIFVCKYSVSVTNSGATPLDPIIIIEK